MALVKTEGLKPVGPVSPASMEELVPGETGPRPWGRGWRTGIIMLGAVLAAVACAIIGLAFVQGSWWYSYGTDRALDRESRARIEAIRDELSARGVVPDAVAWLDAALRPDAHPSDTRAYLLSAQEVLKAADDPQLTEVAIELRAIIRTVQQYPQKYTATPRPMPTLEWP